MKKTVQDKVRECIRQSWCIRSVCLGCARKDESCYYMIERIIKYVKDSV